MVECYQYGGSIGGVIVQVVVYWQVFIDIDIGVVVCWQVIVFVGGMYQQMCGVNDQIFFVWYVGYWCQQVQLVVSMWFDG